MEIMNVLSLPRGFGFYPTDVELVSHYLKRKSLGQKIDCEIIPEVDIYKYEPWDLPAKCHVPTRDSKWHFFNTRDRKYRNGSRSNRATEAGYWKSTGKDRRIKSNNRVVGTKKTLVFHKGRPPSGKRTDWIMHEYYLGENEYNASPGMKDTFVLCRVTKRDGLVQEAEVSSKIDDYADQPKGVTDLVVQGDVGDVDDVEAWIQELYEPNFCSIPAITELKEKDNLVAPKREVDNPCSPPNISEESVHFLPGTDETKCFLDKDIHEFDIDFFGEYGIGVALDDILTPSEAAEQGENPIPYMYSSTSFNVVGNHGSDFICENGDNTKNTRNEDTGIQIRQCRPGFSTTVTKERIRLQTHKMESRNGKIINGTVECVDEDHHLEFKNGSDVYALPFKAPNLPKPEVEKEIVPQAQCSENNPGALSSNNGLTLQKRRFGPGDPERLARIHSENKSYIKVLNILFLAGIFALMLYFLLPVAALFSGRSSSSEL